MASQPGAEESGAYVVPPGAGGRADKVLARARPEHSRAGWQRAFEAGLILRRGVPLDKNDAVRPGDEIAFAFPAAAPSDLVPKDIPLEVLHEDRQILVVNKPSGMVVHPGAGTGGDTLVHALLAHCAKTGGLSGIGGVERPGIVHRLDRETSGAIVIAKTDAAHRALAEQFAERRAGKEYLALVSGVPSLLSGSIRRPIGRHPRHRHKMMAFDAPGGPSFGEDAPEDEGVDSAEDSGGPHRRDAHTEWALVESYGQAAQIRCILHTGRTHQIRVHLKSIGHVLIGDAVYGFKPAPGLPPIPRVMLHSHRLTIEHPRTKKTMTFEAPLPADFQKVIRALRQASKASAAKPQRRL